MDVKRRALPVWRERSKQMQLFNAGCGSDPAQRELLAGVFELNRQGWFGGLHHQSQYRL